MSELRPCGGCVGGIRHVIDAPKRKYVYCAKCGMRTGDFDTEAEAVTAWNTRKIEDALVEALEDCRTNFSGYIIHETKDYEQVIAEFWKEIQRIDKAARAALRLAKGE
jgi:hypothetical protein